ncbi:MAG TPA: hypothetical protein VFP59_20315 [Candidatus Angelobacter sp.]|jgi:hypothetical protein|nr:hypothetical protein [Candidatus Angelobacter sp.]
MKSAKSFLLVALSAIVMLPLTAQAQFTVFDPTNYANALNEFAQLRQMYTTALQTRDQIISTYNLAFQMSRMPLNLAARYKSDFSQWTNMTAPNTYGNTAAWIDTLNLGTPARASSAYSTAVIQPQSYPSDALTGLDATTQSIIRNEYATSELGQATVTNSLATVGAVRSASEAFSRKLQNLEADTYSTSPDQQTEMAVLGKINTATLLQIHSQQDANQMLAATVAQQALQEKERLDEQNRLINQAVYFHQNFPTTMQQVSGGVSTAIHAISLSPNGR